MSATSRSRKRWDGGETREEEEEEEEEYTEMEKQVVALRRRHPDKLLLFECGYRMRMFEQDAQNASRVLGIAAHPHRHLVEASVPTFRVQYHTRRLVLAGFKVGIVRQLAMDPSVKLKDRQVAQVYSRATIGIGEENALTYDDPTNEQDQLMALSPAVTRTHFILSICERTRHAKELFATSTLADATIALQQNLTVGVFAHDPHTGESFFDEFHDDAERHHLRTRLLSIEPEEILHSNELSTLTRQLLEEYKRTMKSRILGVIHFEVVDESHFAYDGAKKLQQDLFRRADQAYGSLQDDDPPKLPESCVRCFGALVNYLQGFQLTRSLFWLRYTPFRHVQKVLRLNVETQRDLDLLYDSATGCERHSLFGVLNHTTTSFGARTLRQWIATPLADYEGIAQRQQAVLGLLRSHREVYEELLVMLQSVQDLLILIQQLHLGKTSPIQLFRLHQCLERSQQCIVNLQREPGKELENPMPALLLKLVQEFPDMTQELLGLSRSLADSTAASRCDVERFVCQAELLQPRAKNQVQSIHCQLEALEARYQELLLHYRDMLGDQTLEFKTLKIAGVKTIEHLVEVPHDRLSTVPSDWLQLNSTLQRVRFHPQEILQCHLEQVEVLQRKRTLIGVAWQRFLTSLDGQLFLKAMQAVRCLSQLDALCSLATVSQLPGYTIPQFDRCTASTAFLEIVDGKHPILDQTLEKRICIGSSLELGASSSCWRQSHGQIPRCCMISGPNMSGKSTFLRTCALIVVVAQVGCLVPAASARLSVFDAIYTKMCSRRNAIHTARNETHQEVGQLGALLHQLAPREPSAAEETQRNSLVLIDEIGFGMSDRLARTTSLGVMRFLVSETNCLVLFATHSHQVIRSLVKEFPTTCTAKMLTYGTSTSHSATSSRTASAVDNLFFRYETKPGVNDKSFALHTAQLAGLPQSVCQRARDLLDKKNEEEEEEEARNVM